MSKPVTDLDSLLKAVVRGVAGLRGRGRLGGGGGGGVA